MARHESRLQSELKQTRPFQSIHQRRRCCTEDGDLLRRQLTRQLGPHGSRRSSTTFAILRGAGEGGLPTLSIGERLIETPMTAVDRLEFKGLVRRGAASRIAGSAVLHRRWRASAAGSVGSDPGGESDGDGWNADRGGSGIFSGAIGKMRATE